MTGYRIEIVTEQEGMFSVQAHREETGELAGSSGPIFHSEAEAHDGIVGMFEMAWPAKDPFAVDASIGV